MCTYVYAEGISCTVFKSLGCCLLTQFAAHTHVYTYACMYSYTYIYIYRYICVYTYVDETLITLDQRFGGKIKQIGPGGP